MPYMDDCTRATKNSVFTRGPSAATEQWDQALIWLSRLPPGGPEPRVSSKIAQAPFPQRRHAITLADGLFGCNASINANGASGSDWVQGFIHVSQINLSRWRFKSGPWNVKRGQQSLLCKRRIPSRLTTLFSSVPAWHWMRMMATFKTVITAVLQPLSKFQLTPRDCS